MLQSTSHAVGDKGCCVFRRLLRSFDIYQMPKRRHTNVVRGRGRMRGGMYVDGVGAARVV